MTTDTQTEMAPSEPAPVKLSFMAGWTKWEHLGFSLATAPFLINFQWTWITNGAGYRVSTGGIMGAVACLLALRCLVSVWSTTAGMRKQRFLLGLVLLMMGAVQVGTGFTVYG